MLNVAQQFLEECLFSGVVLAGFLAMLFPLWGRGRRTRCLFIMPNIIMQEGVFLYKIIMDHGRLVQPVGVDEVEGLFARPSGGHAPRRFLSRATGRWKRRL